MARFSVQGIFNYSMLTLSDHERVLYVGAREALFALDPNDISRQLRPQVARSHTLTHSHTLLHRAIHTPVGGKLCDVAHHVEPRTHKGGSTHFIKFHYTICTCVVVHQVGERHEGRRVFKCFVKIQKEILPISK